MSLGRVLVIDDSHIVLRVVEGILSKAGYTVHCLDNGVNVVDNAVRFQPELVLCDFAMPDTNGFDVCRAFGEHALLEGVPIVIMSTKGDPVVDKFVRTMGVVDHITKPFAPAALLAVVEHRLTKSNREPTARRPTEFNPQLVTPQLERLAAVLREGGVFDSVPQEDPGGRDAQAIPAAARGARGPRRDAHHSRWASPLG